jgi:hypothetical protein
MADKETKSDAKQEDNRPGRPDGDDGPAGGAPLPSPMTHREYNAPMTNADRK